jgi:hypothetical protein
MHGACHKIKYSNRYDTATCIGLNVILRYKSLISFNKPVCSTYYEFYIIGPKVTILIRNMLPEYSI